MTTRRAPDPNAPQTDERLITRRHAVGIGLGVGFVAVAAGAVTFAFAADGGDTLTVWQLATEWKEPRGPNKKTRLVSGASRRAAQYRYARSEKEAELMNLHKGSWAPAIEVQVDRGYFEELWKTYAVTWVNPWSGEKVELIDLRFGTKSRDEADKRQEKLSAPRQESTATTLAPATTTTAAAATTTTAAAATTTTAVPVTTTVPATTTTAVPVTTTVPATTTTAAPIPTTTAAPTTTVPTVTSTAPSPSTTAGAPTTTAAPAQSAGSTTTSTTTGTPTTTTASPASTSTTSTTSTTILGSPTTTAGSGAPITTVPRSTTTTPPTTTTSGAPATTTSIASGGPRLVTTTTTPPPITNVEGSSERRWPRLLSSNVDTFTEGVPATSYSADEAIAASRVRPAGGGSKATTWALPFGVTAAAAAVGAVLIRRRKLEARPVEVLKNDREPPIT